jgi:hypothetical protein
VSPAVYRVSRAANRAARAVAGGSARGAAYRPYRAVYRGRRLAAADGAWGATDGGEPGE